MNFCSRMLLWYDQNRRVLPWRESSDPYKIWLSEILLQQTRIDQALSYYRKFLDAFPDVHTLACAPQDQVLGLWQGLGYYTRARNLHHTAQDVSTRLQGRFPERYEELCLLKGIGPYTAAAIASIAFHQAVIALDGNVMRVLSRFLGVEQAIDLPLTRRQVFEAGNALICPDRPGCFNQALMDLGSMVCKPRKPLCAQCPLMDSCQARLTQATDRIPVKSPRAKVRHRYFCFLFIGRGQEVLVEKRLGKDIWKNLYQFPLIEWDAVPEDIPGWLNQYGLNRLFGKQAQQLQLQGEVVFMPHQLSHQRLHIYFVRFGMDEEKLLRFAAPYQWVELADFADLGKPVPVEKYLIRFGR